MTFPNYFIYNNNSFGRVILQDINITIGIISLNTFLMSYNGFNIIDGCNLNDNQYVINNDKSTFFYVSNSYMFLQNFSIM